MSDIAQAGRAPVYSDEVIHGILDRIATGELLIKVCAEEGMPRLSTFFRWIENHAGLREAYTRARHDQADFMVEETIRIADEEPDGNRARTRILARQWLAAKLNAGKYSDKLALTGHDGGPLAVQVVRYDLPGDGAKVVEHAAADTPQAPNKVQVIDNAGATVSQVPREGRDDGE